ncbi:unnamed protein product [Rotaria magnacalcarata]|uniref:Uncharacterized protein n=1 Tax=Rotaria magnacalcarata TaxID=392030 RepID=A0A816SJT5_9BILA|nr:unnamed protein product [Rotaria magnacalcarata]
MAKGKIITKDEKIQVTTSSDRPSTSSNSSKEEIHLNAVKYLEEKIDKLDEETLKEINKIDELVDKAHNSANVLIGLREAIDILAQEPNIKDVKLINFLESFYQSAPITKSYTEEAHEQNFKAAVLYSFDTCNEIEALGNLYHDYLEI